MSLAVSMGAALLDRFGAVAAGLRVGAVAVGVHSWAGLSSILGGAMTSNGLLVAIFGGA